MKKFFLQTANQLNYTRRIISTRSCPVPLVKSTSKKAFKKNVKAEVKAKKPIKQAVAIAYTVKKKAAPKKKK